MTLKRCIPFLLCLTLIYGFELKAQVHYEASLQATGDSTLTDMIYVKFKSYDVVQIGEEETKKVGLAILENYAGIRQIFSDFCAERNIAVFKKHSK